MVCQRWASEAGGNFVQFRVVAPDEIEFNKRLSESGGMPGHPFGNYFFCAEHTGLAWKHRRRPWNEAEPLIRKAFETNEIPGPPLRFRIWRGVFRLIDRILDVFFSKS